MSTIIKNGLVLLRTNNGFIPKLNDILIDGDKIKRIETHIQSVSPDIDQIIDAKDMLIMPGMVNSHLHSNENLWKGSWDNMPDEIWAVDCYPSSGYSPLDERLIYLRTLVGAIEMLKTGVTWARDEVFEIPRPTATTIDAILEAYKDCGIRADLSLTMIDTQPWVGLPWIDQSMSQVMRDHFVANPTPTADQFIELCEAAISRWNVTEGRLRFALGPHSPQRCTQKFLLKADELSRKYLVPYNIHVLETITQFVQAKDIYANYGGSTVAFMKDLGILSPRMTFAHAIWVTDDEIRLMGEEGISVDHNIVSNLKLGSGIMPFRKMVEANVNLCLGTDGMSGGAEIQNLFEVMKFTSLVHKVTSPLYEQWPTTFEVLDAATHGGARSGLMGDEIGLIKEGYRADLVLIDLNSIPFTPLNDVVNQLVYSEMGNSIRMVLVNGKVVVNDGKLTMLNEDDILQELRERMPAWKKAYELNTRVARDLWKPTLDKMHRHASSLPVDINRFSTPQNLWK